MTSPPANRQPSSIFANIFTLEITLITEFFFHCRKMDSNSNSIPESSGPTLFNLSVDARSITFEGGGFLHRKIVEYPIGGQNARCSSVISEKANVRTLQGCRTYLLLVMDISQFLSAETPKGNVSGNDQTIGGQLEDVET
jgi:hypothetical protein